MYLHQAGVVGPNTVAAEYLRVTPAANRLLVPESLGLMIAERIPTITSLGGLALPVMEEIFQYGYATRTTDPPTHEIIDAASLEELAAKAREAWEPLVRIHGDFSSVKLLLNERKSHNADKQPDFGGFVANPDEIAVLERLEASLPRHAERSRNPSPHSGTHI